MPTKKFILLSYILMICSISSVAAENLSVTVLEKGSGDPIEGATVVLGQTGEYDVTNSKGIIVFEDIDPVSQLKILNSGHETLETTLDQKLKTFTFYLYPISVEGEALEVVEDRVQEKVSKITLVKEELRRVPGTAGDRKSVV